MPDPEFRAILDSLRRACRRIEDAVALLNPWRAVRVAVGVPDDVQ